MEPIKYFFECLIPITVCNMKCHYCYVVQRGYRTMKMAEMRYSPKQIAEGLSHKRLNGAAYISICGIGETTMVKELPEICLELRKEGHYINITTNGTFIRFFDQFLELIPSEMLARVNFSFSFHYLELERMKAFEKFFANINRVKDAGCSILVQFNLCDEYEPHLEDIKRMCLENVGALPQIAATRDEFSLSKDIRLFTKHSVEEYVHSVDDFDSPLFKFTMKNFMVKRREYCYAGKWGGSLNLATGIFHPCYGSPVAFDIFKDPSKPIPFRAMGKHCCSLFCTNSSHFISLGMIPEYDAPTYAELRNRQTKKGEWYNETMKEVLSQKLYNNQELDTAIQKITSDIYYRIMGGGYNCKQLLKKVLRPIIKE